MHNSQLNFSINPQFTSYNHISTNNFIYSKTPSMIYQLGPINSNFPKFQQNRPTIMPYLLNKNECFKKKERAPLKCTKCHQIIQVEADQRRRSTNAFYCLGCSQQKMCQETIDLGDDTKLVEHELNSSQMERTSKTNQDQSGKNIQTYPVSLESNDNYIKFIRSKEKVKELPLAQLNTMLNQILHNQGKNNNFQIPKEYSAEFLRFVKSNLEKLMKQFLESRFKKNIPTKLHKEELSTNKKGIFKINKLVKIPINSYRKIENEKPNSKIVCQTNRLSVPSKLLTKNDNDKPDQIQNLSLSGRKIIDIKINKPNQNLLEMDKLNKNLPRIDSFFQELKVRSAIYFERINKKTLNKVPPRILGKLLQVWNFSVNILKVGQIDHEEFYSKLDDKDRTNSYIANLHITLLQFLVEELIFLKFEEVKCKTLLMLKIILSENEIDELLKMTWFEISCIILQSTDHQSFLVVDCREKLNSLQTCSTQNYHYINTDLKLEIIENLIALSLNSRRIKHRLETEKEELKSKREKFYEFKLNYLNFKQRSKNLNSKSDNPNDIEIEKQKLNSHVGYLKNVGDSLENEIYSSVLSKYNYLGKDSYGNKYFYFFRIHNKVFVKLPSSKWITISYTNDLIDVILSLDDKVRCEFDLKRRFLIIFPNLLKLRQGDDYKMSSFLSKANLFFHNVRSDFDIVITEENEEKSFEHQCFEILDLRQLNKKVFKRIIPDFIQSAEEKQQNLNSQAKDYSECLYKLSSKLLKSIEEKYSDYLGSICKIWDTRGRKALLLEKIDKAVGNKNFELMKTLFIFMTEKMQTSASTEPKESSVSDDVVFKDKGIFKIKTVQLWKKELVNLGLKNSFTQFLKKEMTSVESLYLAVLFFSVVVKIFLNSQMSKKKIKQSPSSSRISESAENRFGEEESQDENENKAHKKNGNKSDEDFTIIESDNDSEDYEVTRQIKNKLQRKRMTKLKRIHTTGGVISKKTGIENVVNVCYICGKVDDLQFCSACPNAFHEACHPQINKAKLKCEECMKKKIFQVHKN